MAGTYIDEIIDANGDHNPLQDTIAQNGIIANTQLLKDTVGWNNKNKIGWKIGYAYSSTDGSLTPNANCAVSDLIPVSQGDKFRGSKKVALSNTNDTMIYRTYDSNKALTGTGTVLSNTDLSQVVTIGSGVAYIGVMQFHVGANITKEWLDTNEIMFMDNDILDSTYEPYRGTTAFDWKSNARTGVHQLLDLNLNEIKGYNTGGTWNGNVYTYNGIDYTVLTDASGNVTGINVNGTASARGYIYIKENIDLGSANAQFYDGHVVGDYILSDGVNNAVIGDKFCYYNAGSHAIYILVDNGVQVNNVIFYPLIRYKEDSCSDYGLYAMTNKELTDVVTPVPFLDMSKTVYSGGTYTDLNNIKTSGMYAVFGSALNKPSDIVACQNSTLIVTANTASTTVSQTLINATEHSIYTRLFDGSSWGSWYKFSGTEVS